MALSPRYPPPLPNVEVKCERRVSGNGLWAHDHWSSMFRAKIERMREREGEREREIEREGQGATCMRTKFSLTRHACACGTFHAV